MPEKDRIDWFKDVDRDPELLTLEVMRNIGGILNNLHLKLDRLARLGGNFSWLPVDETTARLRSPERVKKRLETHHGTAYANSPGALSQFSDLFKSETTAEFYAHIDQAIIQCGFTPEQVEKNNRDVLCNERDGLHVRPRNRRFSKSKK